MQFNPSTLTASYSSITFSFRLVTQTDIAVDDDDSL